VIYVTFTERSVTIPAVVQRTFKAKLKDTIMPLLNIFIVLIVAGILLWLVNSFIPMDRKIKSILNVVVVIVVIIWLLNVFGVLGKIGGVTI
jgi:hypothetical protein